MNGGDNKYDPNVIIQAANDKLAASDLEGGQMIFQSALLTWVDDAREGHGQDIESLREAVATLWLAYAHFLAGAKQFKSATEAYEQAVSCPVARSVGRVWLDYARFATERGKYKTAQDVYMRALIGGTTSGEEHGPAVEDEQDQTLLWHEFLDMMRLNNPSLTMQELERACAQQFEQARAANASSSSSNNFPEAVTSIFGGLSGEEYDSTTSPPAKRARNTSPVPPMGSSAPSRTHVVTPESVEIEASALLENLTQAQSLGAELSGASSLPPEVAAQWMLRDGTGTAQAPEPPLFGEPTPPKLSDPTAKDILGVDLALAVIQRLLLPHSGNILLDVCRGLWALHALKEKQAQAAIDMIDKTTMQEYERLESNLDARLSVAGAAFSAVQQMNHNERMAFQATCNQQRQHVLVGIAWEFRHLLCVQQELLTKLGVPGFEGATVDASDLEMQSKICSYLHSAFYLRSRIGEQPHINMLKSQVKRLQREQEESQTLNRMSPVPPQQGGSRSPAPGLTRQSPKMGNGMTMQQLPPPPPPVMIMPPMQPQAQAYYGGPVLPPPPPTAMQHPLPGMGMPLMHAGAVLYPGQPQQHQQQQQPQHPHLPPHMMHQNQAQYPPYYQ